MVRTVRYMYAKFTKRNDSITAGTEVIKNSLEIQNTQKYSEAAKMQSLSDHLCLDFT